jgi:dihydroorotase
MRFDLLIRGGHVIDPSAGYDGLLDVAIRRNRVAAVDRDIPETAAVSAIDATGKIVTPGLVDLHAHVFRGVTYWGIDADAFASRTGVTTWVDAGSAGALTMGGFREFVVDPARVRIYPFLNISCIGLVAENYELSRLEWVDVELCRRLVDQNRDLVVGVKVRMGSPTVGDHGIEPMRRARAAADECELPLMVHVALGPPSIAEVLELMRPGDILTHCFTGLTMKIVDDDGRLYDFAARAWDGGVIMDIGHGAGSFSFEVAEALLAAGRRPDVISTDAHQLSVRGPMFDLPTCMSKFLSLGVPLPDVVRAATSRPAEVIGLGSEIGTLRPGAFADIAILTLHRGRFAFHDIHGAVRVGAELLRGAQTIVNGRLLEPVPEPPPAPWVEPLWPPAQAEFAEKQRGVLELGHHPDAMAAAAPTSAD